MQRSNQKKSPFPIVIPIIIIVVVAILAVLLLTNQDTASTITATEWNAEYSQVYNNDEGSMKFPNYDDGDTIIITGTITSMEYSEVNSTQYSPGYTYTDLELDGTQLAGLKWNGDLRNVYNVGDKVEITFHIEEGSIPWNYI